MEIARPAVSILTDGSGGNQISRATYSSTSIAAAGATAGPVFAAMSDRAWYDAILARDAEPFLGIVGAIVEASEGVSLVVSDAVDGYNPVHDLTSAIGAAVAKRLSISNGAVDHLVSAAVPGVVGAIARDVSLDAAACARKVAAINAYLPLAEEAQRILQSDPASLAREILLNESFAWPEDFEPGWEQFAKKRVDTGRYQTPITYRDHVRPIALAILGDA